MVKTEGLATRSFRGSMSCRIRLHWMYWISLRVACWTTNVSSHLAKDFDISIIAHHSASVNICDMKCTKGRSAKCEVQLRPPRLKQKRKEVRDAGGIWRIWRIWREAEWSIRMTSMTPWFFGPFFPSSMILLFGPLWYGSVITTQSISVSCPGGGATVAIIFLLLLVVMGVWTLKSGMIWVCHGLPSISLGEKQIKAV